MQKVIYVPPGAAVTNRKKRVVLAAEEPFILASVSGVSGEENDIMSTAAVGLNGEVFQGIKKLPRPIRCSMTVKGSTLSELYAERMRLIGLLQVRDKQVGTLYYENDHIRFCIPAVAKTAGQAGERIRRYDRMTVEFWCAEPDWRSVDEQRVDIVYEEGQRFSFPTELNEVRFLLVNSDFIIPYAGTAPAPVTITVCGPSAAPKLRNKTTGQQIRLARALETGETLVISTEKGHKSVKLYSGGSVSDAFGYIDPLSEFWELVPGNNHIVYGDTEGAVMSNGLSVSYHERYAGV